MLNSHSQKDQDQLSLNADQKYCRMLRGEHSAILLTFIKLPFVIKIFVLSFFLSGRFTVLDQDRAILFDDILVTFTPKLTFDS